MAKSTLAKPTLFPHKNGQYAKKIRGKIHYFGTNKTAALKLYLSQRDDLEAGRIPQRSTDDNPTTDYVINAFLTRCKGRVQAGDLSAVSFKDYKNVGELLVAHFGRTTDPTKWTPADFADFRLKMRTKYAPSRLSKIVTVTKGILKWAKASNLIECLPSYGPDFKIAPRKAHRLQRAETGKKLLTRDELLALLDHACPKWKAILLLCINGGLGNSDIARIEMSDVGGEWLEHERGKTGIERRIPLWPETQKAIKEAIAVRKNPKGSPLLFLSGGGGPMISISQDGAHADLASEGFRRVAVAAGIHRPRMGLYWCRHTFQTIGDAAGDPIATSAIMGHAERSMADNYREEIRDERLLKVTNHVRSWLFRQSSQPVETGVGVG